MPSLGLGGSEERTNNKKKEEMEKERRKDKRIRRKAGRFYTLVPVGRRIYYLVRFSQQSLPARGCPKKGNPAMRAHALLQ